MDQPPPPPTVTTFYRGAAPPAGVPSPFSIKPDSGEGCCPWSHSVAFCYKWWLREMESIDRNRKRSSPVPRAEPWSPQRAVPLPAVLGQRGVSSPGIHMQVCSECKEDDKKGAGLLLPPNHIPSISQAVGNLRGNCSPHPYPPSSRSLRWLSCKAHPLPTCASGCRGKSTLLFPSEASILGPKG